MTIMMPCDICGEEPAEWVGTEPWEKPARGMFLCDECRDKPADDLFEIAMLEEKFKSL